MNEKKQKKSAIKERIISFIDSQGITREEFYKKTHITRGILSQNNGISETNLEKFIKFYKEISLDWLLKGNGEMLQKDCQTFSNLQNNDNDIPLLSAEFLDNNNQTSSKNCKHYNIPDFNDLKADGMIRMMDTSMSPTIVTGDILAIKHVKNITFLQWGRTYALNSSQGLLIKRIYEDGDNKENILLTSDNKEKYPPFIFPKSDIRSLYLVLGMIRTL